MKTSIQEHMQELIDRRDETIYQQQTEIERINTAFKSKIQKLEMRYNAIIHKRDRKIEDQDKEIERLTFGISQIASCFALNKDGTVHGGLTPYELRWIQELTQ